MSDNVAEVPETISRDEPAVWVSNLWDRLKNQKRGKDAEILEVRNYRYATDTSTTSNDESEIQWKNKTHLPKLCQTGDNLEANYMDSLFPNNRWLAWQAFDGAAATKEKSKAILSYMSNKVREGNFKKEMRKLVMDYVNNGNPLATVEWVNKVVNSNGQQHKNYVGPVVRRISCNDVVMDATASDFHGTPRIVRAIMTIGSIQKMLQDLPEQRFWEKFMKDRENLVQMEGGFTIDDFHKANAFTVDGFGSLYEYYGSNFVEVLTFYGDYYDREHNELKINQMITVVDRTMLVNQQDITSWNGRPPLFHVGWRERPDMLWAMGPLDNLIGMQYRIDHLENAKADAFDLALHSPLVIKGQVEPFNWGPGCEIHVDDNGEVTEIMRNLGPILTTDQQIQLLEDKMELYAGAPREAMGIRTPGEKTAFEFGELQTAAGRIFKAKVGKFEEFMEEILNEMLEVSVRNMDSEEVISIIGNDQGVQEFLTITKEDISANGRLRPIGARHLTQKSQDLANLVQLSTTPLYAKVQNHLSGLSLTALIDDTLGIVEYNLFSPNVGIEEDADTQRAVSGEQETLETEAAVDTGDL